MAVDYGAAAVQSAAVCVQIGVFMVGGRPGGWLEGRLRIRKGAITYATSAPATRTHNRNNTHNSFMLECMCTLFCGPLHGPCGMHD
jgi:hypothetical protein